MSVLFNICRYCWSIVFHCMNNSWYTIYQHLKTMP
jgi:hypothetical protein